MNRRMKKKAAKKQLAMYYVTKQFPLNKKEWVENRRLVKEFPFLAMPRIRESEKWYPDYTGTFLDDIPKGWRRRFGMEFLRELKGQLEADGLLNDYYVLQVKEKWGRLCWYDCGGSKKTDEIIRKYEELSEKICWKCGAAGTERNGGWILPWCDRCWEEDRM